MSQIFHHTANTYAKMSLVIVALLLGFAGWALDRTSRSDFTTRAMEPREQPVPFSHAHHVGGLGFDCRYCHTSVENSSFANIPPTKTCMNCHSQIWNNAAMLEPVRESFRSDQSIRWIRVHDLPDYVYFNHSIHVAKGVGCTTCHGQVNKMPLMWQENSLQMSWCLDCHRHPERFVRPKSEVFSVNWQPPPNQVEMGRELVKEYNVQSLTSCSTCHR